MRWVTFFLFVAITSTWTSLVQAEPTSLQSLQGQWHQIASNAGKCADCGILIQKSGSELTVEGNTGWSAIVRPVLLQGAIFVAGKGSWKTSIGGTSAGKALYLNLGIVGDKLQMFMIVPSPDGLRDIEATFEKVPASGKAL